MNEQIQAIVTVLSLVNLAICGMMFMQAEVGRCRGERLIVHSMGAQFVSPDITRSCTEGVRLK
jgi:hypothetical protein